jgi:ferric-dicitrate binding protein FerR (iron transport regulator)
MSKNTERKRLKEEFDHEVASGKKTLPEESSARILQALHETIAERAANAAGSAIAERSGSSGRLPLRTPWLRWSAAALVLLLAGSLWRGYHHTPAVTALSVNTAQVKRTNDGPRELSLSLPDGSAVILSPASTLSYAPAFEPGNRNIYLSGKALFDVRADARRPFTVYAGDVNTTVLGTRFIVNALLPGKVNVHLLEGKVVVRTADKGVAMREVYLAPGQQFELDRQRHQYAVSTYHDSAIVAAPKKRNSPAVISVPTNTAILEFKQEPLPHVLAAIGCKYGVVFRLNGRGFNTILVTGKFLPSDSLSSVLSMLGTINKLSFTETGDTIVVAAARP